VARCLIKTPVFRTKGSSCVFAEASDYHRRSFPGAPSSARQSGRSKRKRSDHVEQLNFGETRRGKQCSVGVCITVAVSHLGNL